jgi:hypothetical protein
MQTTTTTNVILATSSATIQQLTCNICAEKYNKTVRKCIECEYCHYAACRQCCQTYLITDGVSFPKCMNTECNREWTRKFCVASFTGVFLNKTYKTHCEQLLYDQELALLPATQPYVERLMEQERIDEEIEQIKLQIRMLYTQRTVLYTQRYHVGRAETTRATFVRACPDPDCRGFLSSQWKCGLCEKWSCPECSEVKGIDRNAPHECNPDNVASTTLMRRDTKPCPTCGMGIFRISGCSQLWCTQCHTAFCWNTGRIETRHVHNPHYFEWMRMQNGAGNGALPRDPTDIPCGRELDTVFTRGMMKIFDKLLIPDRQNKHLLRMVRQTIHIARIEINNYRTDAVADNRELRIKYLRKYIGENEFKQILQKNHKKNSKKREIMDVLQMMVLTCTDILHRLYAELKIVAVQQSESRIVNMDSELSSAIDAETFVAESRNTAGKLCTQYADEIKHLTEYANGCFLVIGTTYACVPMMFDSHLDLVRGIKSTGATTAIAVEAAAAAAAVADAST